MRPTISILSTAVIAMLLTACEPSSSEDRVHVAENDSKVMIVATNTPLAYFAARVGGDLVHPEYPGPSGEDPAFWTPGDASIQLMQEADLILMNGASYEKWLSQISLPEAKMVDTSASFKDDFLQSGETTTHSHGPGGDHSHSGTAFTTWIDFSQAASQAQTICDALVQESPEHAAAFKEGLARLRSDLDALDQRMQSIANRIGKQPLLASHPVYQYWARRYSLNIKAVLWEPETFPSDEQWNEIKTLLQSHPAKWMIWEGVPASESVKKLEDMGIRSLVFDPCGGPPDKAEGDWLSVMKSNLDGLEASFSGN